VHNFDASVNQPKVLHDFQNVLVNYTKIIDAQLKELPQINNLIARNFNISKNAL
jgi:hypothetical protein